MRDWLSYVERRFSSADLWFGHGTHRARDESAWLLAHVTGLPHERLARSLAYQLSATERRRALRLVAERLRTRRPLAYLIKEAWLGDHRFYVDERVVVPRSFIAELLRERLKPWIPRPAAVRQALDLCTGSGCLAILLAFAFPRAIVTATDVSRAALAVARRNIKAYRLGQRVNLRRADLFSGLEPARFDLITANPPYVDAKALRSLPREYEREPRLALDGGRDGLHFVRRILLEAARFLSPGSFLLMEIGHNRSRIERAFPRVPFIWLQTSVGNDHVLLLAREDLPRVS